MRRLSQLHERTRRRIGLGGFVLLCLLPTVGMFTWGVSRHLPAEEAAMEERLGQLFGLKVSVASVEHPEPGVVRLRGVRFDRPCLTDKDGEETSLSDTTAKTVARLATLEIRQQRLVDPLKKLRDTLCMTGTRLEVNREELPELIRLFREAVDYRLNTVKFNVKLVMDRVRWFDASEEVPGEFSDTDLRQGQEKTARPELSGVQFKLLALEDGPQAIVDFRLVQSEEDTASQPIRFRVGQRLDSCLCFEFDTQSELVPCEWIAMFLPQFDLAGPEALFRGCFWAEMSPDGWNGDLPKKSVDRPDAVAEFFNVDLYHLINRRFSQTFSGRVNLTIEQGRFFSGRLEQLRGNVVSSESGMIGQPLLAAAATEFGMRVEPFYTPQPVIRYERMAAQFALDEGGIAVVGGYPRPDGSRAILLGTNNRPILWESGRRSDITALLRTLAPEADSHIPAVQSVEHLSRRLPAKGK